MRVALLFGGPSDERGVSAGSLKPWVTYLRAAPEVELTVVFFDREKRAFRLPRRYEFTNTCEDFEAQLGERERLDDAAFADFLRGQDLVVPLVHGRLGEDGEIQARLEALGVPYLFSRPPALAASLDKARCYAQLAAAGLPVPQHEVFSRAAWREDPAQLFALARRFAPRRGRLAAVKPLDAGSSLGVSLVPDDARAFAVAVEAALAHSNEVLIEEVLDGTEFSCIVLEDERGRAVALAPTAIELSAPGRAEPAELYDTRSKYLQGEGARLHTPLPDTAAVEPVRRAAARAFEALGLRHMARIDGFLTPGTTGARRVLVTDVNGISGTSFSSFAFLQTSMVGLSHADLVHLLLARAGRPAVGSGAAPRARGPRLHVVLGGTTSERQVSRQSGVFAGLCLASRGFDVRFFLMDTAARFTEIGLFFALHHDIEEIQALVASPERRATIERLARTIGAELGLAPEHATRHLTVGPTTDLAGAVRWSDEHGRERPADFVFLGLHGGSGEDGTIQSALELLGVPYNGADARCSRLCSDKWESQETLARAAIPGVRVPRHRLLPREELCAWLAGTDTDAEWDRRFAALTAELGSTALVCKPRSDGCSTGVRLARSGAELRDFLRAVATLRSAYLPPGARRPIKLPEPSPREWILEQALVEPVPVPLPAGDRHATRLQDWFSRKRWVEITCAVLEHGGDLHVPMPSVAVAAGTELSLEEKFQQGEGTNIELSEFLPRAATDTVRARVGALARALGIRGYARIDCFYDRAADELWPLEANTLCGLTEATVFYTQLLASLGLSPPETLACIVDAGLARAAAAATRPALSPFRAG